MNSRPFHLVATITSYKRTKYTYIWACHFMKDFLWNSRREYELVQSVLGSTFVKAHKSQNNPNTMLHKKQTYIECSKERLLVSFGKEIIENRFIREKALQNSLGHLNWALFYLRALFFLGITWNRRLRAWRWVRATRRLFRHVFVFGFFIFCLSGRSVEEIYFVLDRVFVDVIAFFIHLIYNCRVWSGNIWVISKNTLFEREGWGWLRRREFWEWWNLIRRLFCLGCFVRRAELANSIFFINKCKIIFLCLNSSLIVSTFLHIEITYGTFELIKLLVVL